VQDSSLIQQMKKVYLIATPKAKCSKNKDVELNHSTEEWTSFASVNELE
jgi:hypothetical protein